ncbi:DUF1036 domain-containing protein [Shimia sediminis]|uniref:DUF1036 domain-containing protein n=1 Tax=Shimia sediminis TaxID=2497945 RepID=UPI000F8CC278|nr:DUF1036 domain-containing protein [Shimia sediminis]
MFRTVFVIATLFGLPAQAELVVCNETDTKVSFALGYKASGDWTSEGWWNIPPYDCSVVEGEDLKNRYYYYRVTSPVYAWPGENYYFCTTKAAFTIVGDEDCEAQGYDRAEFRQIDTGEAKSFTLNLTAEGAETLSQSHLDEIAPPGTHGEPFTISGILSHCDFHDVTVACEVHAEGFRYIAYSADPTPPWMIEELVELGLNQPITISGDMISYEGNTADITVRSYETHGDDPYADLRAAMQGMWRSLDDPSYQVVIYGGVFEELYDLTPTDMSAMFYADECPPTADFGPAFTLKTMYNNAQAEDRCMVVLNAGRTLELAPAGVMNTLRFEKVH